MTEDHADGTARGAETATDEAAARQTGVEPLLEAASERLRTYPWPLGMAAGVASFVVGYALVFGIYVYGQNPFEIGWPHVVAGGWTFYNAHFVDIVAETSGRVVTGFNQPLELAQIPLLYWAAPLVAVGGASAVLTYRLAPEDTDLGLAIATGLAMTIGYLLLGLVGSYILVENQAFNEGTATFYPQRLPTLTNMLLYPLVVGFAGSVLAQAPIANRNARTESDRSTEPGDGPGPNADAEDGD